MGMRNINWRSKVVVVLMLLGPLSLPVYAAFNCPNDQTYCYEKIIWKRDINLGGEQLTENERAILHSYIPNHYDYSIVKISNGSIVQESTTGFFADDSFKKLIALFLLNPFNETDGHVRPSECTSGHPRGSTIVRQEFISEEEYDQRLTYNEDLKNDAFPDSYSLPGENCRGYANNMYDDGENGLE